MTTLARLHVLKVGAAEARRERDEASGRYDAALAKLVAACPHEEIWEMTRGVYRGDFWGFERAPVFLCPFCGLKYRGHNPPPPFSGDRVTRRDVRYEEISGLDCTVFDRERPAPSVHGDD